LDGLPRGLLVGVVGVVGIFGDAIGCFVRGDIGVVRLPLLVVVVVVVVVVRVGVLTGVVVAFKLLRVVYLDGLFVVLGVSTLLSNHYSFSIPRENIGFPIEKKKETHLVAVAGVVAASVLPCLEGFLRLFNASPALASTPVLAPLSGECVTATATLVVVVVTLW